MSNPYAAPTADLTLRHESGDTYEPAVFSFSGRIGRVRYLAYSTLYGLLAVLVLGVIVGIMVASNHAESAMSAIATFVVVTTAIGFIAAKRRVNDMNLSSWLGLLMVIPYLNMLVWLWLACARGTDGENDYGPAPCPNSRGVVVAAWMIPGSVVIIGILAAIAIPAYADYTKKSRAAQGISVPAALERSP